MLTADQYKEAEFGYTLAESKRGFKIHAIVYAIVMTGLITLNALLWVFASGDFPWAVFPLIGWGIGLAAHYIFGVRRAGVTIRDRQRNVEQYRERERELVS